MAFSSAPPDTTALPDANPGGRLDAAACERVFRRAGLPLLVEGHTAARDVFGRSAPFLLMVLFAEFAGAARLGWPVWVNVLALLGAVAIAVAGYGALNLARRRVWSTLPQSVGGWELAFFVVLPAVLPLVFGGAWTIALWIAAGNLLLLGALRVAVGFGVFAALWWGLARLGSELGSSLLRLVRLLPLLLVFSLVLFYTTELWQVFDTTHATSDVVLGGFFALVIVGFVGLRVPSEARQALAEAAAAVPGGDRAAVLSRAQRANVDAMLAASQLVQVLVVSAGIGAFFTALGVLTITPQTMELWGVDGGTWVREIDLGGAQLVISRTLIRVAVALATFTGLYYALSVQVDATYREEFVDDVGARLRDVLATRVRYLAIHADHPPAK